MAHQSQIEMAMYDPATRRSGHMIIDKSIVPDSLAACEITAAERKAALSYLSRALCDNPDKDTIIAMILGDISDLA